jgi:hypothetical protein
MCNWLFTIEYFNLGIFPYELTALGLLEQTSQFVNIWDSHINCSLGGFAR